MKKLYAIILLMGAILVSCNTGTKKDASDNTATITVASFDTAAYRYVEKPVNIEGTVTHICKHSGKRMFLADGNDSVLVEITTGPEITKFDETLMGSRVKVSGILKELRIDDKYLNEWEAELKKPAENHEAGVHTGQKGHEDQTADDKFAQINAYRDQIKASGTDHLSFYSIEATSVSEVK